MGLYYTKQVMIGEEYMIMRFSKINTLQLRCKLKISLTLVIWELRTTFPSVCQANNSTTGNCHTCDCHSNSHHCTRHTIAANGMAHSSFCLGLEFYRVFHNRL